MWLGSSVAASSSGNKKKKEARYLLLFLTLIVALNLLETCKLLEGFYLLYSYHIGTERKQLDSHLCVKSSSAPLSFSASNIVLKDKKIWVVVRLELSIQFFSENAGFIFA
jgi:hypothetical protein